MNSTIRPARFLTEDLATPSHTPLAVVTTLADFAIITYEVEPSALATHLPAGFEPEIFVLDNGTRCALVSAVTFQDRDFRLCACPWPRFSFGQTNYRAYVLHQGSRVAWFFGTSLATPFVIVPRHLWLLPWHHATMRFSTTWHDDVCKHYELSTKSSWGTAEVILEGTSEPVGCLDGFLDIEDTAVILTHPLVGFYHRRDGKVGTYSVWHDRLLMRRAVARQAHFEVFQKLGLCQAGQKPHSVLIQRETEFTIMLPPKLVTSS
jgi:uncharacterized protein YqjF (DUF2071 family)